MSSLQARVGPKRILIFSDSLGTPIHPRGIFYYTTNLIRALKACGHDLTLLVETTGRHKARAPRMGQLDAIREYLASKEFAGYYPIGPACWAPHLRRFRVPTRALPLLSWRGAALALHVSKPIQMGRVANSAANDLPEDMKYMDHVSEFMTSRAIYTLSRAASVLGLEVPTIDARGYDFVLVDAPSYVRFETSAGARTVGVVHDLIPLTDNSMAAMERRSFQHKLEATLASVTDLVYVSQASKDHLTQMFPDHVRGKKEAILHPTIADETAPGQRFADPIQTADKEGYFVTILSDEVRKNLDMLVRSLALFPPGIRLKVLGYFAADRQAFFTALDPRVEFLGYVSDAVKKETLAGSLGLIMPSYLEGFGIPLIEAAFHGRPVFCSDIPVFREVMGEHAFYFDPHSPESISQAIRAYLAEPSTFQTRIAAAQTESRRRFGLSALTAAVEAFFDRSGSFR